MNKTMPSDSLVAVLSLTVVAGLLAAEPQSQVRATGSCQARMQPIEPIWSCSISCSITAQRLLVR